VYFIFLSDTSERDTFPQILKKVLKKKNLSEQTSANTLLVTPKEAASSSISLKPGRSQLGLCTGAALRIK